MKIKKYKRQPHAPKYFTDEAKDMWRIYCGYFIDRDYLTEDLLPDIEHLCNLQQERMNVQKQLNKEPKGTDRRLELTSELRQISTELRLYKKHLKIYPRANEFNATEKTAAQKKAEAKERKEKAKMKLLG